MTPVEWVISMHFLAFEVKVSPVSCLLHMTSSNNTSCGFTVSVSLFTAICVLVWYSSVRVSNLKLRL